MTRIREAVLLPFRLPLVRPWRSAAGTVTERRGWLLRLGTQNNRTGWGECCPLPDAGTESLAAAEAGLTALVAGLAGREAGEILAGLAGLGFDLPAARGALETALLDLLAQAAGQPLARFLDVNAGDGVAVNAASSLEGPIPPGFAIIKLKIGLAPLTDELAALATYAARLPANVRLRLDANRAWSLSDAADFIGAASHLPVECLEEPLREADPAALARLQAEANFPLALDESLAHLDLASLLALPPVRRLVLKAPVHGGPRAALQLARRARQAGLECVVTTLLDGACGRLTALHLACAVGNSLAHGLDTAAWLAHDLALTPDIIHGRMSLPADVGLGFCPSSH